MIKLTGERWFALSIFLLFIVVTGATGGHHPDNRHYSQSPKGIRYPTTMLFHFFLHMFG